MIDAVLYFWIFFKASLLSTGGLGNLPSLHQDLVSRGWAANDDFAAALAVGQVSPGPTGLWTVALGYLTFGWAGAAIAMVASSLPPFLILLVERAYARYGTLQVVRDFTAGLGIAVAAVFPIVMLRLVAARGMGTADGLIVALGLGLALTRRVPPALLLAIACAAGIALYR